MSTSAIKQGYTSHTIVFFIMEAKKGKFYISAVWSSTSTAKRGPTARNFIAELYLCGETRSYSVECRCGTLPPWQNEDLQCGISLRSYIHLHGETRTYGAEFHCRGLPPRRNGPYLTAWNFALEIPMVYLHGKTKTTARVAPPTDI